MAKVRVHELAKKYDVPSKDVLKMLNDLGEFVKAPSSTVEPPVEKKFEPPTSRAKKWCWLCSTA